MNELQLWAMLGQVMGAGAGVLYLAVTLTKMNQADSQKQRDDLLKTQSEILKELIDLIKAGQVGSQQTTNSLLEKLEQKTNGVTPNG